MKTLSTAKAVFLAAYLTAVFLTVNDAYPAAAKTVVKEIKHWSNPNYTRIVINLSSKASFSDRLLNKDPSIKVGWRRLYVDIKGASVGPALQKSVPIHDGLLKGARAGQHDKTTVRVVLDIESIKDYKVYPLSADDAYSIVIDVSGEKGGFDKRGETPPSAVPPIKPPGDKTPPVLASRPRVKFGKIVIDAGHGGRDPGAVGKSGLKEKDITLKLAKMLKERLTARLGSKIILTRDTDEYIPLVERTGIANSLDADIFISIHVNSSPKRSASGVETYILSAAKDEETRRLAARENSASASSVSDLEFILNDMLKTAKSNDSMRLAATVHDNLVKGLRGKYTGVRSNGVKGALFYVLVGTRMPSILVEVSFISNKEEERRLKDEKYLRELTEGILAGVVKFVNETGSV
ncbi:MAG: N-acetylmuramoyl-L-alanine amidase [Deltaproteobacteria bacterium]|nr:N-acetylmuramoyl-L-alanine amidase [Deltaproteobacteria bacterium]